jgi:N-hydroxyarylamine O-acetyltransferase
MLLQVEVAGAPQICDVGFGRLTLTGPIRMEAGLEQPTPHEPFRLLPTADGFVLQARLREGWVSIYEFGLEEQSLADYEVASWYHCTNPGSHFNSTLVAARPTPGRRCALRNNEFSDHDVGGATERRTLRSAAELRDVLAGVFGIALPDGPDLAVLLERFTASVMMEQA